MKQTSLTLVVLLCVAELGIMLGNSAFPALVPLFRDLWQLSNGEVGWISGIYYAGYVTAVPFLVAATDARDPRRIYLGAAVISAVAPLAFALLAEGFWSALALRALGGIGLAGTYMVGLRLLTDRIEGKAQARAVAWYTSFFSIGNALSIWLAGLLAAAGDWPLVFYASGLGGALAFLLVLLMVQPGEPRHGKLSWQTLDLRPAFRNRAAFAYNLAYACHGWELFAFRSWLVAFLAFALAGRESELPFGMVATDFASIVLLLGLPASVIGNEMALKRGRNRVIAAVMWGSALLGLLVAWGASWPLWALMVLLLAYGFSVTADSSAITNGAITAAEPERRGATMALHSLLGFAVATPAPVAFGYILDSSGGAEDGGAWFLAFLVLSLGAALGPLCLRLSRHR